MQHPHVFGNPKTNAIVWLSILATTVRHDSSTKPVHHGGHPLLSVRVVIQQLKGSYTKMTVIHYCVVPSLRIVPKSVYVRPPAVHEIHQCLDNCCLLLFRQGASQPVQRYRVSLHVTLGP